MKLVIEVSDESFEGAVHLIEWVRERRYLSEGEVVRIGGPHDEPVFASRILSLSLEVAS